MSNPVDTLPGNSHPASTDVSSNVYTNWRQGFAKPLLLGSLGFGLFALIPAVLSARSAIIGIIFVLVYLLAGIVAFIPFPYTVRIGTFLLIIYILGLSELVTHGILGDSVFFFLGLILFTTMMFSPKAGMIAVAVDLFTFIFFGSLMLAGLIIPINTQAPPASLMDWLSASTMMVMFGVVIIMGFQSLEREFNESQSKVDNSLIQLKNERNNLERIVQERTGQLKRVNEIGRSVTSILDPEELLASAVFLIGNEFDCYFTAVYLTDSNNQWAELKQATGDAGQVLRENHHKLDLAGRSSVAHAIRNRKVLISSEAGQDLIQFDNPMLPYSRSQLIIPLMVGEKAVGALELHSTKAKIFSEQNLETHMNLANQIAIALENSRLFQEANQNLIELRATQRQYLQGVWSSLMTERPLSYEIGDEDIDQNEIRIPLTLREQIIGQINMTSNEEWTPEQRNLIETIAAQAALALENARLVEESQSVASREKMANEIISKVWASTNVDSILQTAARELGRALEASQVDIELRMGDRYE